MSVRLDMEVPGAILLRDMKTEAIYALETDGLPQVCVCLCLCLPTAAAAAAAAAAGGVVGVLEHRVEASIAMTTQTHSHTQGWV
jgi:hypothetical protein